MQRTDLFVAAKAARVGETSNPGLRGETANPGLRSETWGTRIGGGGCGLGCAISTVAVRV
jgi:hypothetical protein